MKHIFNILFLLSIQLVCVAQSTQSETKIIPPNTIAITTDSTFVYPQPGGFQQPFYVCAGHTLFLTGFSTHVGTIYLENNATLIIDDTMNFYLMAKIYMKSGSVLDWNRKLGSYVDTLIQETGAILIDTGAASIQHHIVTNILTFNYSLLPGAVSPCGSTGIAPTTVIRKDYAYPNPNESGILFLPQKSVSQEFLNFEIYATNGQLISSGKTSSVKPQITLPKIEGTVLLRVDGYSNQLINLK